MKDFNENNHGEISEYPEAAVGTEPMRKFEHLINAANELNDVKSHLTELYTAIGYSQDSKQEVPSETPKQRAPTLVSTLDDLPGKIRADIKDIHSMIQNIISVLN